MKSSDNIEKMFTQTNIKTNTDMDKLVLGDAVNAMSKSNQEQQSTPDTYTWRIIMQSKITKYAAAAILIAVMIGINQFGGSIDGAGTVWAEIVQKLELSYNKYNEDLLLAMEQKDLEKAYSNAKALSEFWQGIHVLARAKLDPAIPLESEDSIKLIERIFGKYAYDDIDESDFQDYANEFLNWFNRIEDEAWIYEVIHISKQMEEYAEEIRDAGTDSDLPYAEHCMLGFTAYSNSFEQLPWDNSQEHMSSDAILAAIKRDLELARQEIADLKISDFDRFADRCIRQAQRNAQSLNKNMKSRQMASQWKLSYRLTQKVDKLSGLISYLRISGGDITLTNKIHNPEAVRKILTKKFGDKDSFADYLIEQIDQTLALRDELYEGFGHTQ